MSEQTSNEQRAEEVGHRLVAGSNKGVDCICGWFGRGADFPAHATAAIAAALDEAEARGRAEVLARVGALAAEMWRTVEAGDASGSAYEDAASDLNALVTDLDQPSRAGQTGEGR